MNRALVSVTVTMLLITGCLAIVAHAQDNPDTRGKLTIPWDEFKKLLNLDDDEVVVSMETFQKLLAQTGAQTIPPHLLKNGNVVLTRAEFKNLIGQMKPPPGAGGEPPFAHLITKAIYSGTMNPRSTAFTATFSVHVLRKDGYVKVPILPNHIALADIKVDDEPALLISDNGYHNVVLPEPGEYVVTATYSLKSSLDKGPHKIDMNIQPTPITLLTLEMPLKDIDVEIPQAQQVLARPSDGSTVVSAVIAQGSAISVRWRKQVAAAEKIPPKLYAEIHHLISIQDDALKTNSIVNYNILHSEVDAVRLVIPDNMNVLTVNGEGIGEWQEITQDDRRILIVPFTYGKKGPASVSVTTETAFSESGLANAFSGLQALDTVRETGFIGIELATSAEVTVTEHDGLEKIAVQKLPHALVNRSARPLIMGFKYLKHPHGLVFDIKKHDKIAVPIATINSASVVTLFTEDGKIVHRLVYQVRNSAKQFLEIQLPDNTDVWSVFVGGQPVESSLNGKGKLLVPLIRSQSVNNQLNTFPVEVIYCSVQDRFSPFGSQVCALPTVDLLTSQIMWSVYLPNDYSYVYFKSTLEKEEIIRGVNVRGARRRYDGNAMKELDKLEKLSSADEAKKAYKGKDHRSEFRNVPMEESVLSSQVMNELEFGGRLQGLADSDAPASIAGAVSTGVLPIQIRVPTSGQVYRFARTIIKTEDPLMFSVVYTRMWVTTLAKWIIGILIALIIYLNRRSFIKTGRYVGGRLGGIAEWLRHRERLIKRYAQSVTTSIVLLGLLVISWGRWPYLSLPLLLLFWVSMGYHLVRLWRKRSQLKAASKQPAGEHGGTP